MTKQKLMKDLVETVSELRDIIDEIKESFDLDDEDLNFLRDFFKDYKSSYSLSLAYPEELWVETAKSIGIDVEGKDRLQLAKEVFTRSDEIENEEKEKSKKENTQDE